MISYFEAIMKSSEENFIFLNPFRYNLQFQRKIYEYMRKRRENDPRKREKMPDVHGIYIRFLGRKHCFVEKWTEKEKIDYL